MSTGLETAHAFSTSEERKALLARLARVEGQIRGVQRMIERDDDCGRIAQQLAAARGALNKAFFELIACAFEARLGGKNSSTEVRSNIAELAELLAKYA
jgi:DNA-binding FrmR family transcriptional regulator